MPSQLPVSVMLGSDETCFVSPKSVRKACSCPPCDSMRTFPGFTSRWTKPRACAASSASAACATMRAARAGSSPPLAASCLRSVPATKRIVTYSESPSSPASKIGITLGWSIDAASFDS